MSKLAKQLRKLTSRNQQDVSVIQGGGLIPGDTKNTQKKKKIRQDRESSVKITHKSITLIPHCMLCPAMGHLGLMTQNLVEQVKGDSENYDEMNFSLAYQNATKGQLSMEAGSSGS